MNSYIYKSLKKDELYLYITCKDDFSSVPETLLKSFGQLEFVMELELTPDRSLARENVNHVMENLSQKGFFVQMPPLITPESITEKNSKLH